jgi:hypothetical protein
MEKMRGAGITDATVVGEVVKDNPGKIFIKEVELSVSFSLDP